ncbi:MAG: hypothetical protein ACRD1Q_03780 [Vicinamibacterales bacterium]
MSKMLLRASWVVYAAALVLPAVRSTTLNASRPTYGWEIVVSFPLFIVNPLLLTRPMIWAYITVVYASNLVVWLGPRFRWRILQGRAPAGLRLAMALALVCAMSIAAGVPTRLGVAVEQLLIGYYCWVLSIVLSIAALLLPDGDLPVRGPA